MSAPEALISVLACPVVCATIGPILCLVSSYYDLSYWTSHYMSFYACGNPTINLSEGLDEGVDALTRACRLLMDVCYTDRRCARCSMSCCQ